MEHEFDAKGDSVLKVKGKLASVSLAVLMFWGASISPAVSAEDPNGPAGKFEIQSAIEKATSEGYDISVVGDKISLGATNAREATASGMQSTIDIVLEGASSSALAGAVKELTEKGIVPKRTAVNAFAPVATASVGGTLPGGYNVSHYCSVGNYQYSDANGTFNIRNNCPYDNNNWSFQFSPGVNSIITSYISEGGMRWTKNNINMSANASHYVPKGYWFHGTLTPVYHNDRISYNDVFTFSVNVAGKPGTGTLSIVGYNILNYDW